jgi:hypothetical protein
MQRVSQTRGALFCASWGGAVGFVLAVGVEGRGYRQVVIWDLIRAIKVIHL